jgi:hypothetical protein
MVELPRFGRWQRIEVSISGPPSPSASQAAREAPWIAHSGRWVLKLMLTCPNRQFVATSPKGEEMIQNLADLGFEFLHRAVPGGTLAYVKDPVTVELDTVEALVDLQRRIGLPLTIEDGVLEIGG